MSDDSGIINLHSTGLKGTSLYDSAYTVYGDDGWYYKFNPCNGFYAANHYDLAVSRYLLKCGTHANIYIYTIHTSRSPQLGSRIYRNTVNSRRCRANGRGPV